METCSIDTATKFECEITVFIGEREACGKSIMALMILAAAKDTEIEIKAEGLDAEDALAAIGVLLEARFYEDG